MKKLSNKRPLRGADLWHLAIAKTIQNQLPELQLLTYDSRLKAAVQGEGMEPKLADYSKRQI
jgi:predicted nucleic acid-binding protein